MRWATLALIAVTAWACNDVRDFGGHWTGSRVGNAAPLKVGPGTQATLQIDVIDTHGIRGQLSIDGLIDNAPIVSLSGAEADALSNMTFAGNPLRVFLAFAITRDSKGDATVLIALYDDDRVEVRALRGGDSPVYAIFALERSTE